MAHNHDRAQEAHAPIEDHHELTLYEKRAYAIESLLLEKGVLTADAIRQKLEEIDAVTPALGARVVAHKRQDKHRFPLITRRYAAIGIPSCLLSSQR